MESVNHNGIMFQNDKRYVRQEINPYRGNRYAIYERNAGRPDTLIFWSHSIEAAMITWERIKDQPVKQTNHDLIF